MAAKDASYQRAPDAAAPYEPDSSALPSGLTEAEAQVAGSLLGFFDADWYVQRYPDVGAAGLDPLRHFIQFGIAERRDPNPYFDSLWYLRHYPDVAAAGVLPLLHYMTAGAAELRNPHPRFDAVWYVDEHPEAAANPLVHYMRVGRRQGFATERGFDIADWMPSTRSVPRPPGGCAADIIIPVYKGLEETRRCIESVLADPDRLAGAVIVIDDRSPEPALSAWLDTMAARGVIRLLRNRRNLGFVGSVNLGMRAADPTHDVVLLNSDTEVPAGWLRRLAGHAWSGRRIASVSPFSNNATICSYPRDQGWTLPFGCTLAEIDAICQAANAGRSVPVPTTVGFCMYIRRDALTAVGLFDEKAFGRGYGEENDFCMRAAALGWGHLLACDTFVYHAGSVSFGAEAAVRSAGGQDVLSARYPDYHARIARHVRTDRVAPFRFVVTAALFRRSGLPVILLVCHDLGGGVRRHVDLLVERLQGRAHFLLLSVNERGIVLTVPAVPGHAALIVASDRMDELTQVLRLAAVRRVHLHHLAGIDIDIRGLIHRLGVPFDVTVHDYFAICPQVTLLPWTEGTHCGEPGPATCNACIAERASHGAREILSWRLEQTWQFREADRVICPSEDVRNRLARYGLADRAVVAAHEPHPASPWSVRAPRPAGRRLRVAVIGVLANHKGAHVVAALAAAARDWLEIHLIGAPETGFPEELLPLLHATGRYEEADLPGLLAERRPHVVWFPAPWPETYSYTLSAALAAELPIVATRIGAFPERLADRPLTWLVPPTQSARVWCDVFAAVRDTLARTRGSVIGPMRPAAADFYGEDYLTPALTAPAIRSETLIDLRRPGRISAVVIPERIGDGLLSPCAYIRLLQPLDHPAIGAGIDAILADAETALRYRTDVLLTQRHAVPDPTAAQALIRHARTSGATLVYDMDDDLLDIPRDHADAAELRPKAETVRRLIRGAGAVWVSTEPLATRVRELRPDVTVVPNGIDERLWLDRVPSPGPPFGPVRILYMGTATHGADFAIVAPALERLVRDFAPHVSVDIIGVTASGTLPPGLNRIGVSANGAQSYPGFVNWITGQPAWDIGLAPLADTAFNRAKSVIKTLDCAALGLAVLASDMPVYRGSLADGPGGLLVANHPDAWYAALSGLIRDRDERRRLAAGAGAVLRDSGTLAAQAAFRRSLWEGLPRGDEAVATPPAPPARTRGRRRA